MIARLFVVGLVFLLGACTSKEVLLHDLSERDANEVVSVLFDASITARKQLDPKAKNYFIEVPKSDAQRATAVLGAVGLPKAPRPSLNDVFKASGFAPTPFEERIRFIYGTTQELERTISLMNGVLTARVHVVIPEQAKRGTAPEPAKASVLISYDDRVNLDLEVPAVRRLISESVSGLAAERVEILLTPVKVDMKKVSSIPLNSFLGIRIHHDDFVTFIAMWLAMIATILGMGAWIARSLTKGRK